MFKTIKIMHLRACNFVGGPEKQILEHFKNIDRKRFTPVLATFANSDENDHLGVYSRKLGFETIRIADLSPVDPRLIACLIFSLRKAKIDILCTHGYKPNILGLIASKLVRIPSVAISRGWTGESRKITLYERIDKSLLGFNQRIVSVSYGQQEKILACGIPQRKISVIHNAISLPGESNQPSNSLRSELGFQEGTLVVASAGRLSPEKNYKSMVETARIVCEKYKNVRFVIFGEGTLRNELEMQIREAGLSKMFVLPGFRDDLTALLPQIDVFMLPSYSEGLPNVALEAYAARKPIIATSVGGTPEVVQNGLSGLLRTPDDIAGLSTGLMELLEDASLRGRMGEAGYLHIKENFNFETQTLKYEELYLELLSD